MPRTNPYHSRTESHADTLSFPDSNANADPFA
jgi:hypothetical protein